jgi:hypothetical protein
LSSTDTSIRNQTQNTVINWIQQASQLHIHPIILGDFNTQDITHSSSSKYKLINFLNNSNMYDIGAHFNNKHSTWSNNTSSSRIDYIWTDQFNIQFLLSYSLDNSQTSTFSDHLILSSTWTFPHAYSKPLRKHTGINRRIFNYKTMSTENWESFANTLSQKLLLHKTPIDNETHESIETTWHKIQCSIIYTATHTIPNKVSRKRSYNHQYSPHSTLLHLSLKKLGHTIKLVKKLTQYSDISSINQNISQINKQSQCDLQLLTSTNPTFI